MDRCSGRPRTQGGRRQYRAISTIGKRCISGYQPISCIYYPSGRDATRNFISGAGQRTRIVYHRAISKRNIPKKRLVAGDLQQNMGANCPTPRGYIHGLLFTRWHFPQNKPQHPPQTRWYLSAGRNFDYAGHEYSAYP